jgi:hypothetical protein
LLWKADWNKLLNTQHNTGMLKNNEYV